MKRSVLIALMVGLWVDCFELAAVAQEGTLSLNSAQRAQIWRSLSREAMRTSEPAGLTVGQVIPSTMHLLRFTRRIREKVPAIKGYSYALPHGEVLIVDPESKKIVLIVGNEKAALYREARLRT